MTDPKQQNGVSPGMPAMPAPPVAPEEPSSKRYLVTVERECVAYAKSAEEAGRKALDYLRGISTEQPAVRPIRVTKVEELGAAEDERHEIVDRAPSRETRS